MKTKSGFTLVELLISVALIAIITTYAIPNYRDFVRNNKIISSTNDFVSTLNIARAEAAKRKVTVSICGSTDAATCNTNKFEDGWIVFTDVNFDGAINGADELLIVQSDIGSVFVRGVSFSNNAIVKYSSRGTIDSTGSFVVCDEKRGPKFAKAMNINVTGRIRAATDDTGTGIVNDVDGSDVVCP